MNRFILFFFLALASFQVSAQNMKFAESTPVQQTTDTLTIGAKTFEVIVSSRGSHSIARTSKAGKAYKQYLGYPTKETYKGSVVYCNKAEDEYFYFVLGRTGWPSKKSLKVVQ